MRQGPGNLKDRIRPFVMRRLKENVAKDLPPKILVDQKVELSALQVDLYKRVLASADYRWVMEEIEAKGVQRSKVLILKIYTTLRSICNHPALAKEEHHGNAINYEDSGKLDCLKELMEEIVDGEHRTLLFCQSTQMLDIIQNFFRQWQFRSIRLDGNTPPPLRPDLVREFNGNPAIQCFLISTRAGGTGLNLTGADTVIFYDHDWNPANDSQAQDRAYRIGQTKPVTVYRLISQGTIEEKILHRQELKQSLADEVIGADEEGFKDLDREELLSLFRLDAAQSCVTSRVHRRAEGFLLYPAGLLGAHSSDRTAGQEQIVSDPPGRIAATERPLLAIATGTDRLRASIIQRESHQFYCTSIFFTVTQREEIRWVKKVKGSTPTGNEICPFAEEDGEEQGAVQRRSERENRSSHGPSTIRASLPRPSPVGYRTATACDHQIGRGGPDSWQCSRRGLRHRREPPVSGSQRPRSVGPRFRAGCHRASQGESCPARDRRPFHRRECPGIEEARAGSSTP